MSAVANNLPTATLYLDVFEKMDAILSSHTHRVELSSIRSRTLLKDLRRLLEANDGKVHRESELSNWWFAFECLLTPLWASVSNIEAKEDALDLECRVRQAEVIVTALTPLLRSHVQTLG